MVCVGVCQPPAPPVTHRYRLAGDPFVACLRLRRLGGPPRRGADHGQLRRLVDCSDVMGGQVGRWVGRWVLAGVRALVSSRTFLLEASSQDRELGVLDLGDERSWLSLSPERAKLDGASSRPDKPLDRPPRGSTRPLCTMQRRDRRGPLGRVHPRSAVAGDRSLRGLNSHPTGLTIDSQLDMKILYIASKSQDSSTCVAFPATNHGSGKPVVCRTCSTGHAIHVTMMYHDYFNVDLTWHPTRSAGRRVA